MSNYSQTTNFTAKDALLSGNPAKLIKGADFDVEFAAIAAAIATKLEAANGANPSATVGLTAVNGSAGSYMRSDGAPALSQAIVPTWTGIHTFSANLVSTSSGASPSVSASNIQLRGGLSATISYVNGAAGVDTRIWDTTVGSDGSFHIRSVNDAYSVGKDALAIARAANVLSSVNFGNSTDNPTFGFLGTGKVTVGGALDVTGLARVADDGGTLQVAGFRGAPLNTQGGNYTLVLSDRGKTVNASANITVTVPNSVFSAGDIVAISVGSGATVTIAAGSGAALQWAGSGAGSGTRTLTGAGLASILFLTSGVGLISGAGLT
jgi:hypothetical protein